MKRVLLFLLASCSDPPPVEEAPAETAETIVEPMVPAPIVSVSLPPVPKERLLASFTTRFKAGKGMEGRVENITLIAKKLSEATP